MALRIDDVDLERDSALVQRFQAGDAAAFDELYSRYRSRLERFCLKRVGDHHVAEELAQEAFSRALAALPTFGGERRFYPWVTVIASRLCADHYRNQARRGLRLDAGDVDGPAVSGGEEAIVDAVDAELVTAAMSRLAPRHQDVLWLRVVQGWSYRRIAEHYQVPISTIETLLFRARRALKREFDLVDGAGLAAIPLLGVMARGLARARDRVAPLASFSTAPSTLVAAVTVAAVAAAIAVVPASQPAARPVAPPAAASGGYSDSSAATRKLATRPTTGAPRAHGPVIAPAGATTTTTTVLGSGGRGAAGVPVVAGAAGAAGASAGGVTVTLPNLNALGLPAVPPVTLPAIPDILGHLTGPGTTVTVPPLVSGIVDPLVRPLKR